MVKKLQVLVGPNRFEMEAAKVNDTEHPFEIDNDKFVGRVLVRIKDFPNGIEAPYFSGRTRRFAIQIEGRFKAREGHLPYTGDEIHFGSDFDHLVDFPRTAFNAGMKVAQWVDPATFWEEKPANGRPYIMSPYTACMNTFSAYPIPQRANDAVVVLRRTEFDSHGTSTPTPGADGDLDGDVVPLEIIDDHKKDHRHTKKYYRFLGYKTNPAVQAYLKVHAPHLLEAQQPTTSSTSSRPLLPHQFSLGTIQRTDSPQPVSGAATPERSSTPSAGDSGSGTPGAPPASGGVLHPQPQKKKLSSLFSALSAHDSSEDQKDADITLASHLHPPTEASTSTTKSKVDEQLGPWRFSNKKSDPVEDNAFVFIDKSVSVAKRRKWFCESDGVNRKKFQYDPDVVYATSFFTNFADLNKFQLDIGPVHLNLEPYFTTMPIRYTLRSTRLVEDGPNGKEEECFATISFAMVDSDE